MIAQLPQQTIGEQPGIATASLPPADVAPLRASLIAAVVYADIFDYPLSIDELAKYQVGTRLTVEEITAALETDADLREALTFAGPYVTLRGRERIINLRAKRGRFAKRLWRRAETYARIMRYLPFVRCVTVTGALAMSNITGKPDIDLLVIASAGRVWICRRALILLVRLARLAGDELCPNFVLSDRTLTLGQCDFFTAHELAQMVPLVGCEHYLQMLGANSWTAEYLPSAATGPRQCRDISPPLLQRAFEAVLSHKVFDRLEAWELARMQARLVPAASGEAEVACGPDQCKGHVGGHRGRINAEYRERLLELGLYEWAPAFLRAELEQSQAPQNAAS